MLIILYTIFQINQVILYILTELKNFTFFVEIYYNMFYNNNNIIKMGEFVVSPILLVADRSAMFTTTVVVAGVSIVLGVLLLLILVFQLFGFIMSRLAGKKKKTTAPTPAPVRTDAPVPALRNSAASSSSSAPVASQGISNEVVAAITAAVVQMDGDGAVVKSIKPVRKIERKDVRSRNPWAMAAISDNTRPF